MLICNFLKVSVIFVVKTFYSYLQMFDLKQSRFVRPPPPSLSQTRLMFPTHWLQLGGIPRYVNSRKSIDVATHFVIFFYIYIYFIHQTEQHHPRLIKWKVNPHCTPPVYWQPHKLCRETERERDILPPVHVGYWLWCHPSCKCRPTCAVVVSL